LNVYRCRKNIKMENLMNARNQRRASIYF
jgi:hypothetical protein